MNWLTAVDNYCERLSPGFWAEPLNAVSNLSFIIVGLLLLAQWRQGPRTIVGLLLSFNVLAIGIGSFLFHTFANRWSEVADVLPITVFIHLYFFSALSRFLKARWWFAAIATVVLFIASPLIGRALWPIFGGSAFYVPAFMAILGVASAAKRSDPAAAWSLLMTGCLFAVSIALRAADLPYCAGLPLGTHMVWHVLNAIVLYRLVALYMRPTATPGAR